ncbi:DODA-type extradiol aromatic ring-opening family dioxygenase [Alteromonas facilis]|uniref:DODA-type extradiol aromatic ring-opening family dioxygenase n=1 Tax=Alteromonas facilis TaxID=2048004 RepID=UPI000C290E84|nr:class III extradiol ring-cleavage dioxygenase [Alteromonas facilis]
MMKNRQPVFFIPHGAGPCFFMDWSPKDEWAKLERYLSEIAETLPSRPTAIVLISAHWLTQDISVTGAEKPSLLYDYYGFPQHTYQLTYPASGMPDLSKRIVDQLSAAGMTATLDNDRGFDHGVFIPLKIMFPAADIPVVQVSLKRSLSAVEHIALGKLLAPLRDEGVLIIGSGMSFHNMRGYGKASFTQPSKRFDDWLAGALSDVASRDEALSAWEKAPGARESHPTGEEEHLIPLMVAVGAAGQDPGMKDFSDTILQTQISAFRFSEETIE